jgi:hypothetical protein
MMAKAKKLACVMGTIDRYESDAAGLSTSRERQQPALNRQNQTSAFNDKNSYLF